MNPAPQKQGSRRFDTPMDWRTHLEGAVRGATLRDAPLAPRTAVRVGGPADLLVRPADPDDLAAVLRAARELGVPVFPLGGGANLLVSDAGVRGVVVKLPPGFGEERIHSTRLAIPGTLGGLVAMNAGTRAGEMKDVVRRVELATAGGAGWLDAAALEFAYRTCRLPPGAVVTRLELELREGDVAASRAAMEADVARRRATQPLDRPTFGSTFRNPPGEFAGRLIEAVGLKGHRVGGAAWSNVHANFIVNLGGAAARDVLDLIGLARGRVRERFGIELEPEVRLVGDFPDRGASDT